MDVFRRYTRRSLAENKTRTLVTIIGIVLSMSLFTAVIEGAYSGLRFLAESVRATQGAYEMYYYDLDEDTAKQAAEQKGVKNYASWQTVGWADIGSQNEYKPYLLIEDVSDNITDLLKVDIIEGRMPEKEDEILLPRHLMDNGSVDYKVGDTFTVDVGRRVSDGWELSVDNPYTPDEGEEITDTVSKTYTVVGIYERFDTNIEFFYCPGYTALTKGGGQGRYTVFLTLKNTRQIYEFISASPVQASHMEHNDLLRMMGIVRSSSIASVIYGFAAVLVFLICFGSISLIYNSFSISVSERTKQFGILKSVGATKKQIRASVLYEALVLSAAGIPVGLVAGCAGIGITLYLLRNDFNKFIYSSDVQMKLVLNPSALLIAVLVCLATTLISAWIPAKRTDRVTAIDAIRQSGDVKIRAKEVKTSKLTQKLFGFEGMMASKNFKRNRKRYRSTVVSLFLSVTLFISASSFCSYLTDIVADENSSVSEVDIRYYTVGDDKPDPDTVKKMLAEADGVKKSAYLERTVNNFITFDTAAVDSELTGNIGSLDIGDGKTSKLGLELQFVEDGVFREFCDENGIDPAEYFDESAPCGLLFNNIIGYSNSGKMFSSRLIDPDHLPVEFTVETVKHMDGYVDNGRTVDDEGREFEAYYPEEYMTEVWYGSEELDRSKATLVPLDEAVQRDVFTVKHAVTTPLFTTSPSQPVIYFPYSMRSAVMNDTLYSQATFETDFFFTSSSHVSTYQEMQKILLERDMDVSRLYDEADSKDTVRTMMLVINVFSYGFIILISLIAMANVFNTISTNISLRRREFAMLKSIGMGQKGFSRMMNYECMIYGFKGLAWGLPASVVMTYVIFRVTNQGFTKIFYIPWYSVFIAVGSVFAVVFATMVYSMSKIKKDNPIDALKNENL